MNYNVSRRNEKEGVIGGVCSGIENVTHIIPANLLRIGLVAGTIFCNAPGAFILGYLAATALKAGIKYFSQNQ